MKSSAVIVYIVASNNVVAIVKIRNIQQKDIHTELEFFSNCIL